VLRSTVVFVPMSVDQAAIHRSRVAQDSLLAMSFVPLISLLTYSRTKLHLTKRSLASNCEEVPTLGPSYSALRTVRMPHALPQHPNATPRAIQEKDLEINEGGNSDQAFSVAMHET
jgi:hypothetical protein